MCGLMSSQNQGRVVMWGKILGDFIRILLWCVLLSLLTNWFSFQSTVLTALAYIAATMESEKVNKRGTNDK